jgi:hypothetical protein
MRDQLAGVGLVTGTKPGTPRPGRAALPVKLLAWIRGARLDEAISHGADPASSQLLARRAAWLTSPRNRHKLAFSLGRVLDPPRGTGLSAAVPPHLDAVADARMQLVRIEALLDQTGEPVYARGVAMVQLLVTETDGPLYSPTRLGQLRLQAEAIIRALEGREETWSR